MNADSEPSRSGSSFTHRLALRSRAERLRNWEIAVSYEAIFVRVPAAFAGSPGNIASFERWIYFSFVTLTTVGYGDITPVATSARALGTFEAFIGQLYPAVILARLVSLQIAPLGKP